MEAPRIMKDEMSGLSAAAEYWFKHTEDLLHEQAEATHVGDARRVAHLGHECVAALSGLCAELADHGHRDRARIEFLLRKTGALKDLALYNQSLIRTAFTGWAAATLDRQRRATGYDALGKPARGQAGARPGPAASGQRAKGTL